MPKVYSFLVPDVTCAVCITALENAICTSPRISIQNIRANLKEKTVVVTVDDTDVPEKEVKAIIKETFTDIGHDCIDPNSVPLGEEEEESSNALSYLLKGILGIVAGGVLMGLCISGLILPAIASYAIAFFGTLLTLYLGWETYSDAFSALFYRKSLTMDSLFTLSTLVAIVVSLASLVFAWLPLMYDAALLILGFNHVGKALKDSVTHKINNNLRFRDKAASEVEVEKPGLEPQKSKIKELLPDDIIVVRRGEVIPADGELLSEDSLVYNTLRSGRSYPQLVKKGSCLYAGSRVPEDIAELRIKVKGCQCSFYLAENAPDSQEALARITRDYRHNAYVLVGQELYYCDKYKKTCRLLAIRDPERVPELRRRLVEGQKLATHETSRCIFEKLSAEQLKLCRDITGHRPDPESYLTLLDARLSEPGEEAPLERTANAIIKYFIPGVIILALISALVIGCVFSPLTALQCAIALLVSACPCAIGMFTALAFKIGLAAAVTVNFKDAKALQSAQEVDVVLLDLNGTLTQGQPQVSSGKKGIAVTNIPTAQLRFLAALEQHSTHTFAKAIRDYLHSQSKRALDDLPLGFHEIDHSHHAGLSAKLQGKHFYAGNRSYMLAQGFTEASLKAAEIAGHEAEHVIYFARDHEILGSILLNDPLRPDAINMVKQLKAMGKEVRLCTGADETTALKYAKKLEISEVVADCLGESDDPQAKTKTRYIHELSQQGFKVGMIGDGLNDTLAIKNAHFGIAVESDDSDRITQQEAGAVIKKINGELSLSPIITAFSIAEKTISKIKQNLIFSLSYNMLAVFLLGGLLVGLGFILNPAVGALLMVIQAALLLANTYSFSVEENTCANDPLIKEQQANTHLQVKRDLEFALTPEQQQRMDKALADPRMQMPPPRLQTVSTELLSPKVESENTSYRALTY